MPRSLKICGLPAFRAAGSCACIRSRGLTGSTSSPPPAPLIPSQAPSHQNRLRRIPGRGLKSPRLSLLRASPGPFSARPVQPRRVPWRRRQRRARRSLRLRPGVPPGLVLAGVVPIHALRRDRDFADTSDCGPALIGLRGNPCGFPRNPESRDYTVSAPRQGYFAPASGGMRSSLPGTPPPR